MIQRFIELGEGYSDIYELLELMKNNRDRVSKLFAFNTTVQDRQVSSIAVAFQPTNPGNFQAIYICREGIPNPEITPNKRYSLFADLANDFDLSIITLDVKPSTMFSEKELYYQHLIGILRMNRYIPPMQ
nr:methylthioribose kinase [Fredinandcohnia onubensis]